MTTSRDSFLVDIDEARLEARIADYFNPDLNHEQIAQRYPAAMKNLSGAPYSDSRAVRALLVKRGSPMQTGFVRYAYRPFDTRWVYWELDSGLLDRPRPDYKPHVFDGNMFLEARQRESTEQFLRGTLVRHLAGDFGNGRSHFFPAWLRDEGLGLGGGGIHRCPNLSDAAEHYLEKLGLCVEDLFYHVLAVLHDPAYREANAGGGWGGRASRCRAGLKASPQMPR